MFFYFPFESEIKQAIAPGRRDDVPPRRWHFDGIRIAADLRPSADESAVRISLVAGGG